MLNPEIYGNGKIFVYKNILPEDFCEYVVDMMNNMDTMLSDNDLFTKLRNWQTSSEIPYVYGSQRRSDKKKINNANPQVKDMYLKLDNAFRSAADIYFKNLNIDIIEEEYTDIALCRYDSGKDMGPHVDYDGEGHIEPIATGLIYLNGNKIGGDLYFKDYDVTVKSEPGTLVIFPCRYTHQSTMIQSGEKYHAATGWKRHNPSKK